MTTRGRWHWFVRPLAGAGLVALSVLCSSTAGCLDRPLVESSPVTTNLVVTQLERDAPDKIDLLFMIDNSPSMADKQVLLAEAVPALVKRLISPRCVDRETGAPKGGFHPCSAGIPEFAPIDDIHVGVITSSLGGHGGALCSPAWDQFNPTQDDAAHLLGERRSLGDGSGFLRWDPKGGSDDADAFVKSFTEHVQAAGERGCGYEAQLEAWYRFLVDPEPPLGISQKDGVVSVEGVDEVVLQQRKEFLRPDSLLAVVMLSDENDCSILDSGQAWFVGNGGNPPMYRSTAACGQSPDDPCCRSCGSSEAEPPAGCAPLAQDPGCASPVYDPAEDDVNLRCFDQKRRFGIDFLQPVERYVDALTKKRIKNRRDEDVANPLFSDLTGAGHAARDPSFVYLAGIVGVPWQDVSSPESLQDPAALRYLSAKELESLERWPWLVPTAGSPPLDPLMIESQLPRSGTNPATGAPLAAPGSSQHNPINGHEWNPGGSDLQYACTYALSEPRDCTTVPASQGCDCRGAASADDAKNPLCQDPVSGQFGTTQHFAKAYPGTRQLRVIAGAGSSGIVASICPKNTGDAQAASYGYNPAVDAIVDRLKEQLTTRCMPRPLTVSPDGSAQCAVVEALPSSCACDASANRSTPGAALSRAVREQLRKAGQCGSESPTGISCDELCLCEIGQTADRESCQNDPDPSGIGWCYVDPDRNMGSPELVKSCPATERRLVRFVGDETPRKGAKVYVACLGAPLGSGD